MEGDHIWLDRIGCLCCGRFPLLLMLVHNAGHDISPPPLLPRQSARPRAERKEIPLPPFSNFLKGGPPSRSTEREVMWPTMKSINESNYGCRSRSKTCVVPLPSVGSTIKSNHGSNNSGMPCVTSVIFTPLPSNDDNRVEPPVWLICIP
jgi:hypothetical protein